MNRRLIRGLEDHLTKIIERFGSLKEPLIACIAGGVAVNYYTRVRMSDDTDIDWSHRVIIPKELQRFLSEDMDGRPILVSMDANFSESIGLFHPDWKQNANEVTRIGDLIIKVITPVDLIVSKIGRFNEQDRNDICELARHEDISTDEVKARAEEAMEYYIGDLDYLKTSISLATDLIHECQKDGNTYRP